MEGSILHPLTWEIMNRDSNSHLWMSALFKPILIQYSMLNQELKRARTSIWIRATCLNN